MRTLGVWIHRWAGLTTALFLFMSGLTGAVVSWDHELDEWLNGHLFDVHTSGPSLLSLDLAARIEAADPRARVSSCRWTPNQGITPVRRAATGKSRTGKLYKLG